MSTIDEASMDLDNRQDRAPEGKRLLTVKEVAEILRLTPKGVYCMVEARRLPFIKISNRVRFLNADVLAYVAANRVLPSEKSR